MAKASPSKKAAATSVRKTAKRSAVRSITPFLWFNGQFEAAATFYVRLFPNSRITSRNGMGGSFNLCGQEFLAIDAGPQYKFSPAVSFFVVCDDQAEVDRLWAALAKEGKPNRCGWIDDKFGLTWQIIPQRFLELTGDPDPAKVGAVFQAMMGMGKFDVAGLEAAYEAAGKPAAAKRATAKKGR